MKFFVGTAVAALLSAPTFSQAQTLAQTQAHTQSTAPAKLSLKPVIVWAPKYYYRCGDLSNVKDRVKVRSDGSCDWDIQHQRVTEIVIHETEANSGMSLNYLSILQLERLYAPYQRTSSGHYYDFGDGRGKVEVFWAYHKMIRQDGSKLNLLNDDDIAWNSGHWSDNTKSIAIVLDGDFDRHLPPKAMRVALAAQIRKYLRKYPHAKVYGHWEVKGPGTTLCPGRWWKPWADANFAGRRGRAKNEPAKRHRHTQTASARKRNKKVS